MSATTFLDKKTIAELTAKMYLETGAVRFMADKPFIFTSGWASPVYNDSRWLISFPDARSLLMDFSVAGIDPTQVSLEVRGRELLLAGNRESEPPSDDRVYQQMEIERGAFRRVVPLGAEVDADAADATYEDGILTVELPLSRPSVPRSVPIRGTDR